MATDVTLTVNGITFTFEAGEVSKVSSTVQANTELQSFSGYAPAGSLLLDTEGAIKVIEISGRIFETVSSRTSSGTVTTIIAQKQWLESLINGNQGVILLTSNYESQSVLSSSSAISPYQGSFTTTQVKIEQLRFDEEEGNPNILSFTMQVRVGS